MVVFKSKPEYTVLDPNFQPGPKNGHLSERDPEYAAVEKAAEEALRPLWYNDLPIDQWRKLWTTAPPPIPKGCPELGKEVSESYGKVPVRDGTEIEIKIYKSTTPRNRNDALLVFRMHGGGWTVGGHVTEEAESRYLAALENVVVVSVDYRMAPEFPFPYPIEDSWDVLKWCKANGSSLGINPEKIIIAGNSSGANMAAVLAIRARDEGLTGIVAQILAVPVTCHPKLFSQVPNAEKYELLSYEQNHNAGVIDTVRMEFVWDCYVGTNPESDPRHSPLLNEIPALKRLPPALVQVAGCDPMRDEGIAYAEVLKEAGNEVELTIYKGLPHCFYGFTELKRTAEYFEKVVAFVKKYADADAGLGQTI
ncbi:esterase/lipase/thioesterase [Pseudomassariella vexata]|uniref:Esterase/lipase/thioesterase n=1 Tax=Pseudomassariella vexata TaxID=1141098 RepID=A0A1Y2EBI9_9PEZI|nr:esterase/lipase/thioesterase [Pseudomassariella vexata]ORY68930.1 esterase/lipase/thioesterase [Pseudomassariella vexata]